MASKAGTWRDFTLSTASNTIFGGTKIKDVMISLLEDDSWCTRPQATIATMSGASATTGFCVFYDGLTRTVPFTPPTITSDAGDCILTSTPLYYQVTDNGINRN